MGCGVCIDKCDQGALSLEREPMKGEPLEICELMSSSRFITEPAGQYISLVSEEIVSFHHE
jgi:hypothetical protein